MKSINKEFKITTHKNPNEKLSDIEYADDTTFFNKNQIDTMRHVEVFELATNKVGLKINPNKTCFMTNIISESETEQLKQKYNQVEHFKYLGAQIKSIL
jgi:hypothetical protein